MHVLIASDGSELALHAAQRGVALLGRPERITILAVISAIPITDAAGFDGVAYSPEAEKALWDAELEGAHEELSRTASAVSGGQVDKRAELGDAAPTICAIAAEVGRRRDHHRLARPQGREAADARVDQRARRAPCAVPGAGRAREGRVR